ncbi:DUF2059 domain-containing protein [Luteolibacter soli]|uniref:DUF2059 domain-containing protein n=1 Tax=Luteolibacter soli TaxID=3135280 RepID=A0ABU9B0D9_9BACT
MKTFIFLSFLLAGNCLSAAEPAAKKTPTEELLEVMRNEELAVDSAEAAFNATLSQLKASGIPEAAIAEIRTEARAMYVRIFSGPELRKKTIELYEKHFTPEEIVEMTEFYRTPLGQKTLSAMPSIMADAMKVAMPAVQKEMPAFQRKVADIVGKYKKPAGDAPAAPKDGE